VNILKKRIVSYLIFLLLIFNTVIVAQAITDEPKNIDSTSFDDDVPTWNVGDSWTYNINDFTYERNDAGNRFYVDGKINNLKWTVSDTSGSTYEVDISGKLDASYEIYFAAAGLSVTGSFNPAMTRLRGSINFEKTNLQITSFNANIVGITSAVISPIPIPIPIPFKMTVDGSLDTPLPFLDFPLADWKLPWALPEINVVLDTKFGGILGLISFPVTFNTHYAWTPLAFWCLGQQSVTVPEGTFDAWEISSIIGDYFEYFYAPDVGNIIKINVDIGIAKASGELIATNIPH
jgi:hypothetical protein